MNKPATPPTYTGDAEIIDAAEFARLIRANRGLTLYMFARDTAWPSIPGVLGCVMVKLSTKEAIETLSGGGFDAFAWQYSVQIGLHIGSTPASEAVQLRRALLRLQARIAEYERRAADYASHPDDAHHVARYQGWAAKSRGHLAEVEARLAALSAQPSALRSDYAA